MAKRKTAGKRNCRAFCHDCDFVGNWRATKPEAVADGKKHKKEAGNESHEIDYEIKV